MFSYCLKHKSKVAAREVASISTSPELATPDGKKRPVFWTSLAMDRNIFHFSSEILIGPKFKFI